MQNSFSTPYATLWTKAGILDESKNGPQDDQEIHLLLSRTNAYKLRCGTGLSIQIVTLHKIAHIASPLN